MSQGDLSRASEIAATQLSRYETGRAMPRKLAVQRLAMALAVNWQWLDSGEGEIGEYGSLEGAGLSIWIDAELRERLTSFAHYNGLTIEEAVADILDSPLSVYGKEDLPQSPDGQEKLRQMLRAYPSRKPRLQVLAQKVRVKPAEPPNPFEPKISERVVKTHPVRADGSQKMTTEVTEEYKVMHRDERNPKGGNRKIPVTVIKKRTFVKKMGPPKPRP